MGSPQQRLIDSARDIGPELSARAQEIDELRYLPQDLAERLASLGFYRLVAPEDLGGLGVSPVTLCRVVETLAEANGSAAWCVFIGSTSQYLFGAVAKSQLDEMLANPDVITSGVFADSGTALSCERDGVPGYIINGHWRWGSGCRNAGWISGGVHEISATGEPVDRERPLTRAFFRPEEIEIEDNWHVSGLRGSGSSDFVAREVWLPRARMATSIEHTDNADRPIYRFPQFGLLGIPIGAICLGMAQASLDEVIRVAGEKTPQGSRRTLAMRSSLHREMAVADTDLAAARAWFYQSVDAAWSQAQEADAPLRQRAALRAANNHAVTTSARIIDRMYTVVGGTSVFETSCLQRHFRDVHVATQHMMVAEPVMEAVGRIILGLDDRGIGI